MEVLDHQNGFTLMEEVENDGVQNEVTVIKQLSYTARSITCTVPIPCGRLTEEFLIDEDGDIGRVRRGAYVHGSTVL